MAENVHLTDAELDGIMTRIQKLLNMRDHASASVGEAANAAEMVQKLLTQYNLSMSQIESHTGARATSDYGRSDFDLGVSQGYQATWRATLVNSVARYNWCRSVWLHGEEAKPVLVNGGWVRQGPTNSRSALIGKAYNVRVCIELSEWLISELDRLSRASWKQYSALTPGRDGRKTREYESRMFKNSFIQGAISEISARMAEQHRKAQGDSAVTALVVVSDAALSTELRKHFPKLHHAKHNMGSIAGAEAAGRIAGRNISLTPTRKIEGAGNQRRLG